MPYQHREENPFGERWQSLPQGGWQLVLPWRQPMALALFLFGLFWMAIVLWIGAGFWGAIAGMGDMGATSEKGALLLGLKMVFWAFKLMFAFVPLLFVGVGIGLLYASLALLINRTTLICDATSLRISHGPLPWWGGRTVLLRTQVMRLYDSESELPLQVQGQAERTPALFYQDRSQYGRPVLPRMTPVAMRREEVRALQEAISQCWHLSEEGRTDLDLSELVPVGLQVEEQGQDVFVIKRLYQPVAFFYLFFSVLWTSIVSSMAVVLGAVLWETGTVVMILPLLFLIPFFWAGWILFYTTLLMFFNRWVLHLDAEGIYTRQHPLPAQGHHQQARWVDVADWQIQERDVSSRRGVTRTCFVLVLFDRQQKVLMEIPSVGKGDWAGLELSKGDVEYLAGKVMGRLGE